MDKIKRRAGIIVGIVFIIAVLFFHEPEWMEEHSNISTNREIATKSVIQEEEMEKKVKEEKEWGEVKDKRKEYQEIRMPFQVSEYYDDGIWESMLDFDGKLFATGRNYDDQNMLIFWNEKKQKEKVFLPASVFPKNPDTKLKVVPYQNDKQKGYVLYQEIRGKYFCYVIGKEGELIQKISLEKILKKKKIKNATVMTGMIQTGKNRISVIMERNYNRAPHRDIPSYILDINVKKNRLISMKKYNYGIIGVDSDYCYAVQSDEERLYCSYGAGSFTCGRLLIIDRTTGKQAACAEIPKDIRTDDIGDMPRHRFDIRNQTVWLANRTGIYYLKPGDSEWIRVMNPEQSSYLNADYTLSDLTVVDKNTFYLLSYFGDDAESAEILTKYKIKKITMV